MLALKIGDEAIEPVRSFVRAPGNYDTDIVSLATGLECLDATLAVQSTKDEADINIIVRRFGVTGMLPQGVRVPQFSDFGDYVFDYRTAVEAIAMAEDSFMSMTAEVRSRFDNDPQKFLEFCGKPENLEEMRKLGLAVPKVEPEPEKVVKVEVINPSSSPSD